MSDLVTLKITVPRENEFTPASAENLFSSLSYLKDPSLLGKLIGKQASWVSFEIVSIDQAVWFQITLPRQAQSYVEAQIQAAYPSASLSQVEDLIAKTSSSLHVAQLTLAAPYYYPLKNWKSFPDTDPLSALLGVMAKAPSSHNMVVQTILTGGGNWQKYGHHLIVKGVVSPEGTVSHRPDEAVITEKISQPGYKAIIRLATTDPTLLSNLAGSFSLLDRPDGNQLRLKSPKFWQKSSWQQLLASRSLKTMPANQVFNLAEIASFWHLPGQTIRIANIAWGKRILSEPPDNLPVSTGLSEEDKQKINFVARTEFKNTLQTFGIKSKDRRRHVYCIGKTGTGKSTLLANMAISDIRKGEGVAVIDPHGDLVETILNFVPKNRINDVIYFNPADRERPITINPLEVFDPSQKELVVSGIVAIFYKLYAYSWGPRLEHILRNTLMTLVEVPGTTFLDIPVVLTNHKFREKLLEKVQDHIVLKFWHDEFDHMPPNLQQEAISPILNKVGQFISSHLIRNILDTSQSSINLQQVMDEGKILLVNISQGRLGEDNAALLGAMLITQMQLAAMQRINTPEEQRKDFYLYVDEFQNFATQSFIKILSEARKFRLDLVVANQYIGQLPIEVAQAIFGNAGSLVAFSLGAEDAAVFTREFGKVFSEEDLVSLPNFQIAVKLAIDDEVCRPFLATTLPLLSAVNQNKDKIIRTSREHYGVPPRPQAPLPPPPPTSYSYPRQSREGASGATPKQFPQSFPNQNRQASNPKPYSPSH